MSRFAYITSHGERLELDGELRYSGIANDIRSSEWSFNLGAKRVTGLTRNAREVEIKVSSLSIEAAEQLRRAFDGDTLNETPGTLEADGWQQTCYVVAVQLDKLYSPSNYLVATFTAVLLEGYWRKEFKKQFTHATEIVNEWLDHPHDFQHDYGIGVFPEEITIDSLGETPVSFIIYGAAVNPYIIIDGNRYEVDVVVPSGGYLTVDGVKHTITLTDAYGHHTNVFDAGVRGSGKGGGTYIFQPLKPGTHSVAWPSGFGFDLIHYQTEGVPPWSR